MPNAMGWLAMVAALICASSAEAAEARIKKILPHYLDLNGRHTLSPSLYERDAYQKYLRDHPEETSGLRFDMLIRADPSPLMRVRMELRGSLDDQPTSAVVESAPFTHKGGREWQSVTLRGEAFRQLGSVVSWRATLWSGDLLLTEQKSFLW